MCRHTGVGVWRVVRVAALVSIFCQGIDGFGGDVEVLLDGGYVPSIRPGEDMSKAPVSDKAFALGACAYWVRL